MNRRTPEAARRIAESLGPAEKLVQLIINFPDHLWHNRPGVVRNGKWKAATRKEIEEHKATGRVRNGEFRPPGPNPDAIEQVYGTLADIWQANNELAARLASYIMKETDWRDMKVVCAAFLLVQSLARMVGYKPKSNRFFEVLGWKQKQAAEGHRSIGLTDLEIRKVSFEGLSEKEICEKIVAERLGWKQVIGMLPEKLGLTPAILVAMLDQFSDKDLTILTPTLEEFGLLKHEPIKQRWQEALQKQEDQRARNIAKNIRDRETAKRLEDSADAVVVKAVAEATKEADIHIMFIIDTSGSMQGAIDTSKQALSMIVQGFPPEKLHIASFNTVGTLLKPRHHSAAGIQHMLKGIGASGGTIYGSAIDAFRERGVVVPAEADLILFAVGDGAGEGGEALAQHIRNSGYAIKAIAHVVNVAPGSSRGDTVRRAAEALGLPCTEVNVEQFTDVYQVQRTPQSRAGSAAFPPEGLDDREDPADGPARFALLTPGPGEP